MAHFGHVIFYYVLEFLSCFFNGSTGSISRVGSIIGSAFGASSSIGGNSFTGSSASIVLVISGSTSDIYNILYILSILFFKYILSIWSN